MANREALRELQTRLASRLQAARSEDVAAAWLAVTAGGSNYLLPLAQAGEIFPLVKVAPVPYTRAWFLGVSNLRGGLYGVVDLASFMGHGLTPYRTEQLLSACSVVTFNAALELNCALLVDTLAGLRRRDAFAGAAPTQSGSPSYFGSCLTDVSGAQWQEINLQSLAQLPEFLSISA